MRMDADPPPPLDWHPVYRDMVDTLLPWLNGEGQFAHLHDLRVPIQRGWTVGTGPFTFDGELMLRRSRAAGPAPWTDKPYFYEWFVAKDSLGRTITGESRARWL